VVDASVTITVGMPWYGAPELLERAVASVLAQTERDVRLILVGDGADPVATKALHPSSRLLLDDRLVIYTLPTNRGPYFAQEVARRASPDHWYAPHGADDYSEPDHLERLLAVAGDDGDAVITGAVFFHRNGGDVVVHEAGYEVGLYSRARLDMIGGYNPAERMGQDTLMIRLLRLSGELRATHVPTYHRVKRAGALTTAPATRIGSAARNELRARNRAVYAECVRLRKARLIREYRNAIIPSAILDELEEHVARLAERLR
jgi:hypothetical protein